MDDRIFVKDEDSHSRFSWDKLGNIAEGRENLGLDMPVMVYRLMEYSVNHVLHELYGAEQAEEVFRRAGHLAGMEYAKNELPLDAEPGAFVAALHKSLADLKVGILRMEHADFEKGEFTITVHEDLECSGLPATNEVVCCYDEGFIAGVLEAYAGTPFFVREVDCWASGERVCRFRGRSLNGKE